MKAAFPLVIICAAVCILIGQKKLDARKTELVANHQIAFGRVGYTKRQGRVAARAPWATPADAQCLINLHIVNEFQASDIH